MHMQLSTITELLPIATPIIFISYRTSRNNILHVKFEIDQFKESQLNVFVILTLIQLNQRKC